MTVLDLVTLGIAVVSLLIGGGGLVLGIMAERRHRAADRPRLKLRIGTAIPVGLPFLEGQYFVEVVVTNVGKLPVGVNSLDFRLSDGRQIPLYEQQPNAEPFPAVLQTGEQRRAWTDKRMLERTLHTEGVRLVKMRAHLADGSTHEEPLPAGWESLGS